MSDPPTLKDEIAELVGKNVVLDTKSPYLYIGELTSVGTWFLKLGEADVHDTEATRTSKEVYLIEAAKHGIKKNRHDVWVKLTEVVSISALDQVVLY